MTLCTSGVFSTAISRSASRSTPNSAHAALPSSSSRFLKAASAQACAITRAALRKVLLELLHAPADLLGADHALRLEQLLHRAAHDLVLRRRTFVEVPAVGFGMVMIVLVIVAHEKIKPPGRKKLQAFSSQCS